MSRVDKKPTYAHTAIANLALWCGAHVDPDLAERMYGTDFVKVRIAEGLAWQDFETSVSVEDMIPNVDKTAYYVAMRKKGRYPNPRTDIARETMMTIFDGKTPVFEGAAAASVLAPVLMDAARVSIDADAMGNAVDLACEIMSLVANDAMASPEFFDAVGDVLTKNPAIITSLGHTLAIRKAMSSSTSKSVFHAWVSITSPLKFPTTFAELEAMPAAKRFRDSGHALENFGYEVYNMKNITILKNDTEVLVLDADARDKAQKMVSAANACWLFAYLGKTLYTEHLDPIGVKGRISHLFRTGASYVRAGKSTADIAKACSKYNMSIFQGMSEGDPEVDATSKLLAAELEKEALELWPDVVNWVNGYGKAPDHVRMEICKLNQVFMSDDADAEACTERLSEAQAQANVCDKTKHKDFMNFVKAHDLVRQMNKDGSIPNYGGERPSGTWVNRALDGAYVLPDREDWGKTWIEDHYDAPNTVPSEWLDAQDVTWVGPGGGEEPEIDNELKVAWEHGPNIDKERDGHEAWKWALSVGSWLVWATKAENTKNPAKMRLTASADAGTRAGMSSFDRAERDISGATPGFGQGLDPFTLNDKMSAIGKMNRSRPFSIVSSHDVKGWSEFEDREAKNTYLKYEAAKFKDQTIKDSWKVWDQMTSYFNKVGCKYDGAFKNGGVQGLNGAADTLMHAKIIAYIHQTAIEKDLVHGSAHTITCIDDVVYNPNTVIRTYASRSNALTKHIHSTYELLGYPIDPTKSIMALLKYIFLNDAYSDGALIASPIRVAAKIGPDERAAIRDIHSDVASHMATASACAIAQAPPTIAYAFGLLTACAHLYHTVGYQISTTPERAAVWALAPIGEGGLGIPTLREFMCGGDRDRNFTWRHVIYSTTRATSAQRQALAAMSGHDLVPVQASASIRDPFAVVHNYVQPASLKKVDLIRGAMESTFHAKEWDNMRDAGTGAINAMAEAMSEAHANVDALSIQDIVDCFPDSIYTSTMARFASTGAARKILDGKTVWSIARLCARADRKWVHETTTVANTRGAEYLESPATELAAVRRIIHPDLSWQNNVIPNARSYIAFNGVIPSGSQPTGDFVAVETSHIIRPGGRNRICDLASSKGRSVGIKSASDLYTALGKVLRKDVVGAKIAKFSAIMQALEENGADVTHVAELFEKTWGLTYGVLGLNVYDHSFSVKRIASVSAHSHLLALAFRNVYTAASSSVNSLMSFCKSHVGPSLVNPLEVAHTAKLCALNSSHLGGLEHGTFVGILWGFSPAIDTIYEYEISPLTFACGEIIFEGGTLDETIVVPSAETIDKKAAVTGVRFTPAASVPSQVTDVARVALYKVRVDPAVVGSSNRPRTLQPVHRPVPNVAHARNLIATSIIRTRVAEALRAEKCDYVRILWGEASYSGNVLTEGNLWNKVIADAETLLPGHTDALATSLRYITRENRFQRADATEISAAVSDSSGAADRLVKLAYDGVVGNVDAAYSAEQRSIIVAKDPESYNAKARVSVARKRQKALASRYGKRIADAPHAEYASQLQGRRCVRMAVTINDDLSYSFDRSLLVDFFANTSKLSTTEVDARLPATLDALAVCRANEEIEILDNQVGWKSAGFGAGVMEEEAYLVKDLASLNLRIFAIGQQDVGIAYAGRAPHWTTSSIGAAPAVEDPAPAMSTMDFLAAARAKHESGGKTLAELLEGMSSDSDSEEEYYGLW